MKNPLIITSLFFFLAISFPSKGQNMKASVSSVDITPPIEMKYALGGYGERMNKPAEAIHDRIWAKALALREGTRKYAIITLDILGLPSNVKSDLIKRVSGEGWSMKNIMLLPSHSHGSLDQYLHGEGYESSVSFYGPGLGDLISNEIIKTALPLTKAKND